MQIFLQNFERVLSLCGGLKYVEIRVGLVTWKNEENEPWSVIWIMNNNLKVVMASLEERKNEETYIIIITAIGDVGQLGEQNWWSACKGGGERLWSVQGRQVNYDQYRVDVINDYDE